MSHPDAGPRDPQAAAPAPTPGPVPPPPEASAANARPGEAAAPDDAGPREAEPPPGLRMVAIYGDSAGLVTARVQFRAGEVLIRPDQNETLAVVAMLVRETPQNFNDGQPVHLEIEGHADATEKGSKWLSKRRAELVRDALVDIGAPPAALSIRAYGAERPLVPSDNPEHRQLNRRVSFHVTPRE